MQPPKTGGSYAAQPSERCGPGRVGDILKSPGVQGVRRSRSPSMEGGRVVTRRSTSADSSRYVPRHAHAPWRRHLVELTFLLGATLLPAKPARATWAFTDVTQAAGFNYTHGIN